MNSLFRDVCAYEIIRRTVILLLLPRQCIVSAERVFYAGKCFFSLRFSFDRRSLLLLFLFFFSARDHQLWYILRGEINWDEKKLHPNLIWWDEWHSMLIHCFCFSIDRYYCWVWRYAWHQAYQAKPKKRLKRNRPKWQPSAAMKRSKRSAVLGVKDTVTLAVIGEDTMAGKIIMSTITTKKPL